MRRYWQAAIIALARSARLKTLMQSRRSLSELATRFVGGRTADQAVQVAGALWQRGIRSSLFYLGEYVDSAQLAAENVRSLQQIVACLAATDLDVHISVDPTQVGCAMDWTRGCDEIVALAEGVQHAAKHRPGLHCLMLDMEDYSVNEKTLALHAALRAAGRPVALTLQAYLKKTAADIDTLTQTSARVRLVKGAFAEPAAIAFTSRDDIQRNYLRLIDAMLSPRAHAAGFYPVFGTHDDSLHRHVILMAKARGWQSEEYEIEMLYGVRSDVAEALAASGERVRLYLPFGTDWWPYAVRRIGENPANAVLLLRSLL